MVFIQYSEFFNCCCFHPLPAMGMGLADHFLKKCISMAKATRTEKLRYCKPTPVALRQYKFCNTVDSLYDLPKARLLKTPLTCSFL